MRTVYLAYIVLPYAIYESRIKYLIDSKDTVFRHKNGAVTGLYAWSNKKSLIKEFLSTRADLFSIEKKEFEDKSYKKFKRDYSNLRLEKRKYYYNISDKIRYDYGDGYDNNETYAEIVSTKFEYVAATTDKSENMVEFGPSGYLFNDYMIFNEKIQEALDILQYTRLYDTLIPTTPESDEMNDRSDVASAQASYDLTVFGNPIITFDDSEYAILLYLFKYIFFGV